MVVTWKSLWMLLILPLLSTGCAALAGPSAWPATSALGSDLKAYRPSSPLARAKRLFAEPTGTLTLRQAMAATLLGNPELRATAWAVRAREAERLQARLLPNPELEVSAAYGRLEATGKISYVSPLLSRSTRTAAARIVLDNSQGKWQPGLFVTAAVTTREVPAPVLVVRTAIQQRDGEPCIFVAKGDAYTCRGVTLGRGRAARST